jgi:hypothetical protein
VYNRTRVTERRPAWWVTVGAGATCADRARLPLRVIIDEHLDMLLQEIGSDCHRRLLVHLQVAVRCARSTTASAERQVSAAARGRSAAEASGSRLHTLVRRGL